MNGQDVLRCGSCRARTSTDESAYVSGVVTCMECMLKTAPDPGLSSRIDAVLPSGKSLRQFQRDDVLLIASRRRFLVANQMGTGKTIEACVGALRSDAVNVVISPASMRKTWVREIEEWRPDLDVLEVRGRFDWTTKFQSGRPGSVVVSSYGVLPGSPCRGCRSRGVSLCLHDGPDTAFPEWVPPPHSSKVVGSEFRLKRLPYYLPAGLTDSGMRGEKARAELRKVLAGDAPPVPARVLRWKDSPMPSIDKLVVLVGDEIHAVKNPNTERNQLWRELAERVSMSGGHVYGLSGTPVENHPQEYWEVLSALGLERVAFGTFQKFERLFFDWYGNEKGKRRPPTGPDLHEVLLRLSRVRVHRRTRDVLKDLPQIQFQTIEVEITPARIDEINKSVQRMFATRRAWADVQAGETPNPYVHGLSHDEGERRRILFSERVEAYYEQKPWIEDKEIVDAINEVMQPTSWSPGIDQLGRVRRLLSLAKIESVDEWVSSCEEEGEPVVLFSQHVEMVRRFGGRPGWVQFYGGMSDKARNKSIELFQAGAPEAKHGIAVSIGAGREGITLTRARVAGFVDLNWNPARNRQAEARVRRIGSEVHDSILIVRFVAAHPVDKLVLRTLEEKEKLLDAMDKSYEPSLFDDKET